MKVNRSPARGKFLLLSNIFYFKRPLFKFMVTHYF